MFEKAGYNTIVQALQGDKEAIDSIAYLKRDYIRALLKKTAWWLSDSSREDCEQEICIGMMHEIERGIFTI